MSRFGEKLSTFTVRSPSPDGNVLATCVGSTDVTVSMPDPEAIGDYRDAGSLSDQISAALERVFEGARQARGQIFERFSPLRRVDRSQLDAEVRRRLEARDTTVSEASAPDGSVWIETEGLRQWTVSITGESFANLAAPELLAQVNYAIRAVQRVHSRNLRATHGIR